MLTLQNRRRVGFVIKYHLPTGVALVSCFVRRFQKGCVWYKREVVQMQIGVWAERYIEYI